MKACENYVDLILRGVDGELDDREQAQLNSHLVVCDGCKALYETYSGIQAGIQKMDETPRGDLVGAVMQEIRNEKERSSPLYLLKRGKFTLVALAAVLALVVISRLAPMSFSANTAQSQTVNDQSAGAVTRSIAPDTGGAWLPATEEQGAKEADAVEEVLEEAVEEAAPQAAYALEVPQDADDVVMDMDTGSAVADQLKTDGYAYNLYWFPEMTWEQLKGEIPGCVTINLSDGTVVYEVPAEQIDSLLKQYDCRGIWSTEHENACAYIYLG